MPVPGSTIWPAVSTIRRRDRVVQVMLRRRTRKGSLAYRVHRARAPHPPDLPHLPAALLPPGHEGEHLSSQDAIFGIQTLGIKLHNWADNSLS